MKIVKNIDEISGLNRPVVTIGSFDGVHLGHKAIISRVTEIAARTNGVSVAVTFFPHPQIALHPQRAHFYVLNSREEKADLLGSTGLDFLLEIPFTREFASLSYDHFIRKYIVTSIGAKWMVIGYDHHFGKDRLGGFNELKGLSKIHGFELQEVHARIIDGVPVSSTKIRNALIEGNVRQANSLLGYEYSISGKVVYGNRIGRTIGFPTANIEQEDEYKLISAVGVYACKVDYHGKIYKGMGNIGYRPTIDIGNLTIEVNIFDFDDEIYGERIIIYFIERIRDEKKFENLSALRDQLTIDRAHAFEILK